MRVGRGVRLARLALRRAVHFGLVRVRAVRADDERRRALDEEYAIRSAADVVDELGQMKGAAMKAGQMLGYVADALPDAARSILDSLQADAPPMAPSLAAGVVESELGAPPERVFLQWSDEPVAAASIGQVHRAVTSGGREVAVKVQYPGVAEALGADLANADRLLGLFGSVLLKSLDTGAFVAELGDRMAEELDYRLEAEHQAGFARRYAGHPFVHIPDVVTATSTRLVLTSEWVDGLRFDRFLAQASPAAHQRAAEILFRFMQSAIYEHGEFNGDPHPGNFLFDSDGNVTFVDFGFVKRWAPGELEALEPLIDPLFAHDPDGVVVQMERSGFLAAGHGLDPARVYDYVSAPYRPYLQDRFRFTPDFTRRVLGSLLDPNGPFTDVRDRLTMPPSFVVLDRVVWGMSSLLGRLGAENRWRAILDEYRVGGPPTTPLGEAEARWRAERGLRARRDGPGG